MRKFVDLHIVPRVEDEMSCKRLAEVLEVAGYTAIGFSVPTGLMQERIRDLRRIFERNGIETALRVDLTATSRRELLGLLKRFRNSFDIVSVKCMNQNVATVACRDRRVDVVSFDPRNPRARFNHSLANVLRGALEFSLMSTLTGAHLEVLSRIAREMIVARDHDTRVVLSSGSISHLTVRTPLQIAAVASSIGLSAEQSLKAISDIPQSIIERNLRRRSEDYVEEGVTIVSLKAA